MKSLIYAIRQLVCPRGTWIAYHHDFSGFALFEDELMARRYASQESMSVDFVPYGKDVRTEILRK